MNLLGLLKKIILVLCFCMAAFGYSGEASKEKVQIYSPIGKRDPFKPPLANPNGRDSAVVNPLERFTVEQFQLRAVLKGMGKSRAMIEDPEGRSYIVGEGDRIGRERATISKILNSEIIVTEKTFNYLGNLSLYEKILSLPPEKDILQTSPERAGSSNSPAGVSGPSGFGATTPQERETTSKKP